MISSPFFAPKAIKVIAIPLVHEFTAITFLILNFLLINFFNLIVCGPGATHRI